MCHTDTISVQPVAEGIRFVLNNSVLHNLYIQNSFDYQSSTTVPAATLLS